MKAPAAAMAERPTASHTALFLGVLGLILEKREYSHTNILDTHTHVLSTQ